jgi:type VI secretion system secreted protein VgrG
MGAQDLAAAINAGINQTERLLRLDTPLGADVLVPQRVIGKSRIGRNFEFTVDVVSLRDSLELKTLIAQSVTLWIQQTDKTYLPHHGYVHTARRLGSDGGLVGYQLVFSSWLHLLRFRKDARIFQEKTAEDILIEVFNGHPQAQGAFRFDLQTQLPSRSFCVQYEDDWNFVHRLMESEGLYGYFEQAADGKSHMLVITDRLFSLPALSRAERAVLSGRHRRRGGRVGAVERHARSAEYDADDSHVRLQVTADLREPERYECSHAGQSGQPAPASRSIRIHGRVHLR